MIVKLLNKKLNKLIDDAYDGSDWTYPEEFLYPSISKAQRTQTGHHKASAHHLADAIKTLSVALTAKSVAESCGCDPQFFRSYDGDHGDFKVIMSELDADKFYRCAFCVDDTDEGHWGYRVTGLLKEDGVPVAILQKI